MIDGEESKDEIGKGLCFIYSVKLTTITAEVNFKMQNLIRKKANNLSLFDQEQQVLSSSQCGWEKKPKWVWNSRENSLFMSTN